MKFKKADGALLIGLALIFGPWLADISLGMWWYPMALVGLVLIGIAGYGSQMKMLGQGDTGEELLDEIWTWIKKKLKRTDS